MKRSWLPFAFAGVACALLSSELARGQDPPSEDPTYEPRADPSHPDFDRNYDPAADPSHPLRDGRRDPGAAWEGHRRSDGTPSLSAAKGEWHWGELFYGLTYPTKLRVTNDCEQAETLSIFVAGLPYLDLPSSVRVPGKSAVDLDATITTPPEPQLFLTGHERIPEHGIWVDLSERQGEVVLWHPWAGKCKPKRVTYTVAGHIHYDTSPPADGGPEKLATPEPCEVYWRTGEPPARLDEDCTAAFRELAGDYLRFVAPYAERSPELWEWLPDPAEMQQMSAIELLEMKHRADELLQQPPGSPEGGA